MRVALPHLRPFVALCAGALACLAGCDDPVADPRPQLVVVIDTDAPLPAQARDDGTISDDATVDTLRVDVFDADEKRVSNFRDFVTSDVRDWPLSFGVPAPTEESRYGSPVLLRIRLFRAKRATAETLEGQVVLEPPPAATIDRLVRIDLPTEGIQRVGVRLSFACLGSAASFTPGNFTTCIDAERLEASPSEGVVPDPPETSEVGSTELAREVPCSGAPAGKACIPGGFAFLGDADLDGLGEISEDTAPLHAMRISPFALDPTEMTVAEFRTFAGELQSPLPVEPTDFVTASCNWKSEPLGTEDLAVNCILPETAAEVCVLAGQRLGVVGRLATEAQWEFAARGRGKGWRFPWGDDYPGCCVAAADAIGCGITSNVQQPPGSHPASPECGGYGDVTPDGVFDLGGNLSEHVLDDYNDYSEGCWFTRGILQDPVCIDDAAAPNVVRGGDFFNPRMRVLSALRRKGALTDLTVGVRCAYEVPK